MQLCLPNSLVIEVKRVVVKLGTKQITDLESINYQNISNLVREVVDLRSKGLEFILTVSGAIGLGIYDLCHDKSQAEKLTLSQKQALSGLGQVHLMNLFKDEFAKYNLKVGQVLLTHTIFDNRNAYLNARNTLDSMLELGIIPIINENDSVAVEEIKVGDNDRLGAFVSLMAAADCYVMLSDINGLYKNFGTPEQEFVRVVEDINLIIKHAGKQKETFTKGGMVTKIQAARITTVSGVSSIIANGFQENILTRIFSGLSEGTIFLPSKKNLTTKKRWITGKKSKGTIVVDDGAAQAINGHKSLLSSGIISIEGSFNYGDTVLITDRKGLELAVGLTNYSSSDLKLIAGKKNSEIESILGKGSKYSSVVHIDHMILYEHS